MADAQVIACYGARCRVSLGRDRTREAAVRKRAGRPVCGDLVRLEETPETLVVSEILPRRNEFPRADRRGRKQVIAANLDRVIVVVAPEPAPTRDLINRYLVACENVEVPAAICVNKRDRIDPARTAFWEAQAACYRALGYPFIYACAKEEDGLDELLALLRQGTHILAGQSGVGKSSLVGRLLPDVSLETGELSRATGKGRHTTSRTTLYELPGGGQLMDSPGVWEYGIWKMAPEDVAAGFREFSRYLGTCRFADCSHRVEPGCAVAAAAEAGEIDPGRLASYRRIVAAMERLGSRTPG